MNARQLLPTQILRKNTFGPRPLPLPGVRRPPLPVCLTCVFATVRLEVRQFEVALVAAGVGTHEGPLLTGL